MEKPRRAFRNMPMLHRYSASTPRAQKLGVKGYVPQLLHYSRRYLVRLLACQFALLYCKERRVPLRRVQKCSARRRRPTLRNRRARLSTVAELRQLDKTAALEASRLVRINLDGIVAPYVCETFGFTRISTLFTKSYETHRAQLSRINMR